MDKSITRNGFTVLELAVVIIVLAILAVVAAPRFINLKSDAIGAVVDGVGSAIGSGLSLAELRIQMDSNAPSIDYAGNTISLTGGMPAASADTLRVLLNINVPASWSRSWRSTPCIEDEYCILGNMYPGKNGYVEVPGFPLDSNGGLDRVAYIWPAGYTLNSNGCYAYYINEASKGVYYSGAVTEGC